MGIGVVIGVRVLMLVKCGQVKVLGLGRDGGRKVGVKEKVKGM